MNRYACRRRRPGHPFCGVGLARHYDEQGLAVRQVVLNDLVPLLERLGDVVTPGHLWHEAMFELPKAGEQQANISLINTNSYSCSSTPPDMSQPDRSNGDFGLLYGGPGPSRS